MRARRWWIGAVLAMSAWAAAEPRPKPVDIKPFRAQLIVLQDARGGTYVVLPTRDGRIFYGTGSKLYEQVIVGWSADGSTGSWDLTVWAPRVPNLQPGSIARKPDGAYARWCGDNDETGLTELASDKAKAILDKSTFLTSATLRRPYLLARDDAGVYYYVDVLRQQYGGKGFRVFVGKKGAMRPRPLTDIASDSAGDVFATRTGDLRIVRDAGADGKSSVTWVRGEKRAPLVQLDPDLNSTLIFKELGVYTFIGSICEDI